MSKEKAASAEPKFTALVTFTGERAAFMLEAKAKAEATSNVSFAETACVNEAESVLDRQAPAAPVKSAAHKGAPKGSKIPLANELGLSTSEYKRRCRVLEAAGVSLSKETIASVPPFVKKTKAAA